MAQIAHAEVFLSEISTEKTRSFQERYVKQSVAQLLGEREVSRTATLAEASDFLQILVEREEGRNVKTEATLAEAWPLT